jgi:ABC-2 type transport system permease protein
VIFGFFFGSGTLSSGTIEVVNNSNSELSTNLVSLLKKQSDIFNIDEQSGIEAAREKIKDGKAGAAVIIPAGFGATGQEAVTELKILTDPGSAQTAAAVQSVVGAFLTQTNYLVTNTKPIYKFTTEVANPSSSGFGYFDFVLIGIIGMAMMNSAVQGLAISISRYREDQILKRITTTPLAGWKFIVAEVIAQLIENVVQIGIIIAVGVNFFHAHVGNIPALLVVSLTAALLFQLVGFFIAAVTKSSDAAEGMATAVTIPMMFLSGVFFPIDSLPKWFYNIVQLLPLSPLLRNMRSISLDGGHIWDNPTQNLIILVWIVGMLLLTIWRFRLSEE